MQTFPHTDTKDIPAAFGGNRKRNSLFSSGWRIASSCALVACFCFTLLGLSGSQAQAWQWTDRFVAWHDVNQFRCYGDNNSANLCWWESYLLQSYLTMFSATQDTLWLSRLVNHTDTMFALMRDAPDDDNCWPGYRDGYLGWGTTLYDSAGRYQEYLVHDGHICIPVARFIRLVFNTPELRAGFLEKARTYLDRIQNHIIAKWHHNWGATRGQGCDLASFGGWSMVPVNQFLAFGELLLILDDISKSPHYLPASHQTPPAFYSLVPDSMARLFEQELAYWSEHNAYLWHYCPRTNPSPRYEDISHANLDLSFTIEAYHQDHLFGAQDLTRLANILTEVMWNRSNHDPKFSKFVNGTGGYNEYSTLKDWLRLAEFHTSVHRLIEQAYQMHPEWTDPSSTSSCKAQTVANLAAIERSVSDR